MSGKKGNIYIVCLTLFILIITIITFMILMLNVQINTEIYAIKQDLFYIVQNSLLSLNDNELSYGVYLVDEKELKERISSIIKNNYDGKATLENIKYLEGENRVYIEILLNLEPIVLSSKIGNVKLKVNDEVKLKLLETD